MVKCMTYCELCGKEIKIDVWKGYIISEKHLKLQGSKYCKLCDMNYNPS